MGQKDITEKMLADYNDVFADIVNVLLFDGKQIVQEDDLENTKDKSQYKADDNRIHEEERDVTKIVKTGNIRISLVGLEHQTTIDSDEPLRVIAYDGASYKSQLLQKQKERYPVVTIILYFGLKRWKNNKSLHERLNIPDDWKPYVQDYHINVYEIAYLTPEQVAKFKSDFRIVADYFVQTRMNKDYIPSQETIVHVDEILKLMRVLTADSRFEDAQQSLPKGGAVRMCDVLDKVEERGRAEGMLKGEIKVYHQELGYSAEQIADKLHLTTAEVECIISSLEL